jgi:hypothetical protein
MVERIKTNEQYYNPGLAAGVTAAVVGARRQYRQVGDFAALREANAGGYSGHRARLKI